MKSAIFWLEKRFTGHALVQLVPPSSEYLPAGQTANKTELEHGHHHKIVQCQFASEIILSWNPESTQPARRRLRRSRKLML